MTIRQSVDWASPDGQLLAASVYRQMQRRILRGPLIALALLSVVGVIWPCISTTSSFCCLPPRWAC